MKKIIILTVLLLSAFAINLANAQNSQMENDGYLIYLGKDADPATVDSLLNVYNSHEVWVSEYSKVRYWKVNSYPFSINDSITINNIQDLFNAWTSSVDENEPETRENKTDKEHSGVGSISYNYELQKNPQEVLSANSTADSRICQDYFGNALQGNHQVIVDILDTGFDFDGYDNEDYQVNIIGGYDFVNDDEVAQDDMGHGTHITSIISMLNDNTQNNIKLYESKTHNQDGYGSLADIVLAIDYSIDVGANIINASWLYYAPETSGVTPVQVAIETAGEYGILFITAAGNDAVDNDNDYLKAYPASYPSDNILAVSSVGCDTTLSAFSNYGQHYSDICAIGERVPGYVLNGQLALLSGTSQATAYVTAVAANIGTHMEEFDPLTVKQLILDGAKHNNKLNNLVLTEGVVDLNNSLILADSNPAPGNALVSIKHNNSANMESVFPNPFKDDINILLNSNENTDVTVGIFDAFGKKVASKTFRLEKGANALDMQGLSYLKAGIYYVKVKNITKKLIKLD